MHVRSLHRCHELSMHEQIYHWLGVLRCSVCRGPLELAADGPARILCCRRCGSNFDIHHGIPRLLVPERSAAVASFCAQYDELRLREGWASTVPGYYQHLPFCDLSGTHVAEWRRRAQSFQFLLRWLQQNHGGRSLRILELGAGSGWLSRRLADQHAVLALDVNAGPHGLAALPAEQRRFLAVQAELEQPPLASASFDLVIANASLHYARDLTQCFAEVARVLRPGGQFLVMDSPVYPTAEAAHAAAARSTAYYTEHGVPELARHYGGLTEALFTTQKLFRFSRQRRDFVTRELVRKWVREKTGGAVAARFPVWIGGRLPQPQENWQPGRPRAGAVLVHNRHLLTYHCLVKGRDVWRIPGGGIEPNETPEQAVQRELHEELGLTIALQRRFGPYHQPHKADWYFLASTDSAELPRNHARPPEDNCLVQWLSLARLADFDIDPSALKWELVEYFSHHLT